jgi:DNA-binding transcriptional LysR family regulator
MNLRHLRTFIAVAELGTVSRAAEHLRIAQSALSRQISDLEKELGLNLFDRVGRRLLLSGEGEQLLGNCRNLVGYAASLGEQAEELRRGDSGILKVTGSAHLIETVLSTFLSLYTKRFPNVQVRLIEAVGREIVAMVERGEAHLGINLDQVVPAGDDHFARHPVSSIEFLAACRPSFRLAPGDSVDIRQLALHPLCLFDSSFTLRKTFDAACRLAGIHPTIWIESRAPHTLLALAEAGHGIAVVPSFLRHLRYRLETFQITYQGKPLRESRSIFRDKRRPLPRYAQAFCELLAEYMHKHAPVSLPRKRGPR